MASRPKVNPRLGNLIRAAREARGYSQAQLAEILGTAQQTVSHWENYSQYPEVDTWRAIIDTLAIPYDEFITALGVQRKPGDPPPEESLSTAEQKANQALLLVEGLTDRVQNLEDRVAQLLAG